VPTALSSILGGAASTAQRRETYVLTSSNANFPIPAWAQGGKGVMYVTGCGGGGSNGSAGAGGGPGGAGAFAVDHPIPIPSGITTANIQIGAGAAAAAVDANGNNGGATSITLGASAPLSLAGGGAGASSGGSGGMPTVYGTSLSFVNPLVNSSGATVTDINNALNIFSLQNAFYKTLARGVGGGGSSTPPVANLGQPGMTPFGSTTAGYGAGGVTGRPGFLILTFVEGL
jgi:hypothetical protein